MGDVISNLLRGDTRAARFGPWGPARLERLERLAAFLEQFIVVLADRALCRIWAEVMDGARQRDKSRGAAIYW